MFWCSRSSQAENANDRIVYGQKEPSNKEYETPCSLVSPKLLRVNLLLWLCLQNGLGDSAPKLEEVELDRSASHNWMRESPHPRDLMLPGHLLTALCNMDHERVWDRSNELTDSFPQVLAAAVLSTAEHTVAEIISYGVNTSMGSSVIGDSRSDTSR